MISYTSTNPDRDTPEIKGSVNGSNNLTRAKIPNSEMPDLINKTKIFLKKHEIFSDEIISSIEGLGSTRQYIEDGYAKPFSGDIDVITVLPETSIEEINSFLDASLVPKLNELGIPFERSFGNISLFFKKEQNVYPDEDLYIQIDLMLCPTSPGNRIANYQKEVRYHSGDPFVLLDGVHYIKGAHSAILIEQMIQNKGFLMDNLGFYQEQLIKKPNRETLNQLIQTHVQEAGKQNNEKWRKNHDVVNTILNQAFDKKKFEAAFPTTDYPRNTIINPGEKIFGYSKSEVYESLKKLLITKKRYNKDHKKFLNENFGVKQISGFQATLDVLEDQYKTNVFNEEQIQKTLQRYKQKLLKKNKDSLRFDYVGDQLLTRFPFIDLDETTET